jgi:hypothetical protein
MSGFRNYRPICDRIHHAIDLAHGDGRTAVGLALGKEDFPAFQAWLQEAGEALDERAGRYQGLRVRHLPDMYLSRLELTTKPGSPNSILL